MPINHIREKWPNHIDQPNTDYGINCHESNDPADDKVYPSNYGFVQIEVEGIEPTAMSGYDYEFMSASARHQEDE